ncbi:hypothetical protein GCM10010431_54640 [Streptomyces kunmingensis]
MCDDVLKRLPQLNVVEVGAVGEFGQDKSRDCAPLQEPVAAEAPVETEVRAVGATMVPHP